VCVSVCLSLCVCVCVCVCVCTRMRPQRERGAGRVWGLGFREGDRERHLLGCYQRQDGPGRPGTHWNTSGTHAEHIRKCTLLGVPTTGWTRTPGGLDKTSTCLAELLKSQPVYTCSTKAQSRVLLRMCACSQRAPRHQAEDATMGAQQLVLGTH
jgi:hypothetical protein